MILFEKFWWITLISYICFMIKVYEVNYFQSHCVSILIELFNSAEHCYFYISNLLVPCITHVLSTHLLILLNFLLLPVKTAFYINKLQCVMLAGGNRLSFPLLVLLEGISIKGQKVFYENCVGSILIAFYVK